MTHKLVPVLFLAANACSRRDNTPVAVPQPQPEQETMTAVTPTPEPAPEAAPETAAEPIVPPPTPPPQMCAAQVELAPVKGQKMAAVVVKFQQEEGKPATASADTALEGMQAGTYHLVIHEAAECGTDGKKAGK